MTNNIHNTINKKNRTTIALHILIWLLIFLIPYIFNRNPERGHRRHEDAEQNVFLYLNTCLNFIWLSLFYINAEIFIPRLVYTKKILLYILAVIGAFGVAVLVDAMLFKVLNIRRYFDIFSSVKHNFLPLVFTFAVSVAYKAISDKAKADILIKEKQSENLKTELSFLRSQISPHFLFNVLNNIAALARMKSDELEPTVMKLSALMQYMLYETDEDKVVIKSETEYLNSYIDLQKQRYGEELILTVLFDVKEEWQTIEPMLLIPFVENAFKHTGGFMQQPEIFIRLEVDNGQLSFTVKNKFEDNKAIKDKTSGIGLTNVKRRLALLYPLRHKLEIDKKEDWFIVNLQLNLK